MLGNYFTQYDDPRGDTSWLKDSTLKMVLVGYLIPIGILAVVIGNFIIGEVAWPAGRLSGNVCDGYFQTYGDLWHFIGTIMMKLGFAGALFSWYALANHSRTERWAHVCLLSSIVIIVVGMVLHSIGFFV